MDEHAQALAQIATWEPAAICSGFDLSETARACLADAPAAPAYLAALLRAECHADALIFLAHALPRAQAVRWACDCVEAAGGESLSAAARAAVWAARAWIAEPSATRCHDAAMAADRRGLDREGAARFAAFAAAWSGASLAPEGAPPVPPAPALGATAVNAAVTLAAAGDSPATRRERLRDFIGRGILAARP